MQNGILEHIMMVKPESSLLYMSSSRSWYAGSVFSNLMLVLYANGCLLQVRPTACTFVGVYRCFLSAVHPSEDF